MVNHKSLINGIGDNKATSQYYDDWAAKYDHTLNSWKYSAPTKSAILLQNQIIKKPNKILDLACGTGLFGEQLRKMYNECIIYGSDISLESLKIAKDKKIYDKLYKSNFEIKKNYNLKFQLVSIIGAMTYCKDFDRIFENVNSYLLKDGYFLFSHRIDLWKKQNFDSILKKSQTKFNIKFISRPYHYLPLNKDFEKKIKIRLVLLKKI